MVENPSATIITPVYNTEPFLRNCIESVLAQTVSDFQFICIDDGSTDGSPSILSEYAAADDRITVITQERSNAGAARNKGLDIAKGEYLFFLDSDDMFEPQMLEKMLARAHETDADVVLCRSLWLDNISKRTKPIDFAYCPVDDRMLFSGADVARDLFQIAIGWPWDKAFKRGFVEEHKLRFQSLRTTNDAFFVFMAMALSQRFALLDDELVIHRTNNSSSLENTRSASWGGFIDASVAIGEDMKSRGIYETLELSYLQWLVNFVGATFRGLDASVYDEALAETKAKILPIIEGSSYSMDEICRNQYERELFEGLFLDEAELRKSYLRQRDEVEYLRRELDNRYAHMWELIGEAQSKDNRIARLQDDLDDIIEDFTTYDHDVFNSASLRIGRMITAPARRIRDKF